MKLAVLILAAAFGAPASASADTTIYPPSGPVIVVDTADPAPAPQRVRRGQPNHHVQRGPRAPGHIKQRIVAAFDHDGDGRLGPRERRRLLRAIRRIEQRLAAVEERAARAGRHHHPNHQDNAAPSQHGGSTNTNPRGNLGRFDRNGDGNLGPGEVPPRVMRKLQRFDRNGDGWVSPDERPRR